uniref:Uncharacterized protein n=2 Tax=Micromonospora TaxID=1873 RepID=A0A097CRM7_9ACTN|nr:hypothetical protein VASRM7_78 [Verrucosispora sp. MS100047]
MASIASTSSISNVSVSSARSSSVSSGIWVHLPSGCAGHVDRRACGTSGGR